MFSLQLYIYIKYDTCEQHAPLLLSLQHAQKTHKFKGNYNGYPWSLYGRADACSTALKAAINIEG